jgi:hypothetical protein
VIVLGDIISDPAKYREGWRGGRPETECGIGSTLAETETQRRWIPEIIRQYGIKSVADIGAGDLNWISKIDIGCDYYPLDLVPRHPDVKQFDIVASVPPTVEMVMCLWVLNHFPEDAAKQAYANIMASGCKYFMLTWESRLHDFLDLPAIESVVIRKRDDERGNVEIRLVKC